MGRSVKVTLDWKGPYEDAADVTGRAGVYMVIAGQRGPDGTWLLSTYELLDIGQSGKGADRLAGHDREDCWKRNKPANSTVLLKFAAMPSEDYDKTDRRIVECCLRADHRPLPCGTECNQGYNRDDSVTITNKGSHQPLREKYSCTPPKEDRALLKLARDLRDRTQRAAAQVKSQGATAKDRSYAHNSETYNRILFQVRQKYPRAGLLAALPGRIEPVEEWHKGPAGFLSEEEIARHTEVADLSRRLVIALEAITGAYPEGTQAPEKQPALPMWDVFIVHASEDKKAVARPLANALSEKGLEVWYDEFTLTLGDSLRRSINHGLAQSRYGVVILSPDFFAKEWPQQELDGLAALEVDGEKKILPVWHNVTREDVARFSPILADKFAVSTAKGIDTVVAEILRVARPGVDPGAEAVPSREEPALANGPWLYEFIEHFNDPTTIKSYEAPWHIQVKRKAQSLGIVKPAIFEHPRIYGRTVLTYLVEEIPAHVREVQLEFFTGILDELRNEATGQLEEVSQFHTVPVNRIRFEVWVNEGLVFAEERHTVGWSELKRVGPLVPVSNRLEVSFRTDAMGHPQWNWAAWGEPRLVEVSPTSSAAG